MSGAGSEAEVKLRACPFGGKRPRYWSHGLLEVLHVIRCVELDCPALHVCVEEASQEEAVAAWNTRKGGDK